jgi:hypothetical protein
VRFEVRKPLFALLCLIEQDDTMYYRIIDQARRLKKPVRYFTNASAALCAQQVAMGERDG